LGAIIDVAATGITPEQICASLIGLLKKADVSFRRVIVGTSTVSVLPADMNRIAFFPGQPSAGTIRISPNPRMSSTDGILLDASGTTSPLSIFTLAGMAVHEWYGVADAASRELVIVTSSLKCD
jgi:hypothetical protein